MINYLVAMFYLFLNNQEMYQARASRTRIPHMFPRRWTGAGARPEDERRRRARGPWCPVPQELRGEHALRGQFFHGDWAWRRQWNCKEDFVIVTVVLL